MWVSHSGGDDTVAIAALEACGYRTLAFVYDYPVLLVYISQYIIAGDGVAAVGHDIVLLDGLFRQFQYLLGIDFFLRNFLFGLLFRVFVVFIAERESQELFPVGALFFLEGVPVCVAQYEFLAAHGNEQLVAGMEIVQAGELVYCGVSMRISSFLRKSARIASPSF